MDINPLLLWRGKRGMTVRDLSDKSGITASTISRLENGHRKAYLSTLGKLANALDIDVQELLPLLQEK